MRVRGAAYGWDGKELGFGVFIHYVVSGLISAEDGRESVCRECWGGGRFG